MEDRDLTELEGLVVDTMHLYGLEFKEMLGLMQNFFLGNRNLQIQLMDWAESDHYSGDRQKMVDTIFRICLPNHHSGQSLLRDRSRIYARRD